MSILPPQMIAGVPGVIYPLVPRTVAHGMTFGLGPAGYDVRIREEVTLWPVTAENLIRNSLARRFPRLFARRPSFSLASTLESFELPDWLTFKLEDKSSLARRGLSVFNTTAEPGWRGVLTLELKNHGEEVIHLPAGSPIGQACFYTLAAPTTRPYRGRYQNQPAGPVSATAAKPGD